MRLIPTVLQLRDLIPLSMCSVFTSEYLKQYGLPTDVDCWDLEASDSFFDSLILKWVRPFFVSKPLLISVPSNFQLVSCATNVWNSDTTHIPLLTPISLLIEQHLLPPEDHSENSISKPPGDTQDWAIPPIGHHHIVIHTGYDPQHPDNRKDPTLFNGDANHSQCKAWTEFQRSKAATAVEVSSVKDLQDRVSARLRCYHPLLRTST